MTKDEKINEIMNAATEAGFLDTLSDTVINTIYQKVVEHRKSARSAQLREIIAKASEELTILEQK